MFNTTKIGGAMVSVIWLAVTVAAGQTVKPIDKVQALTGRFQVMLTERGPLSKPEDVQKRISQKPGAEDKDYDLSKEVYEAFVPKAAAEDGKYGLMIPMPFGGHGFPPAKWIDVLEEHHLIWLGDINAGDSRPAAQRIGLALDAVHNAEKVWQIDPARVYICPAAASSVADGIALYYPDVFQGQLCSGGWAWYSKISDPRARVIFNTDKLAKPLPEQMALAKARSRFFFAGRENTQPNTVDPDVAIVKEYERTGFKHVKAIYVPSSEITVWSSYPGTWFEQGVVFLDAGAVEAKATATKAGAAPASSKGGATGSPPATAAGGTAADDANRKAASALSLAKNYINAGKYEAARRKLQSLLQMYGNTPSATEAKTLLDQIKDK